MQPASSRPQQQQPASTSSKKKGKDTKKKAAASKTGRPGSSSLSTRRGKFQTVALELPPSSSSAVLNRLPPQGPPEDLEKFDQNRWLEEQLRMTQMMSNLYAEDGSGGACQHLGGALADDYLDEEEEEPEPAWEEVDQLEQQRALTRQMQSLYADDGGGATSGFGGGVEENGEEEEEEGEGEDGQQEEEGEEGEDDEGEEGSEEEVVEASGSNPASKNSTLRSSARARRTKWGRKTPAAVDAMLEKAGVAPRVNLSDGSLQPFCIGRVQPSIGFPEVEVTLPANAPLSYRQGGLFERG